MNSCNTCIFTNTFDVIANIFLHIFLTISFECKHRLYCLSRHEMIFLLQSNYTRTAEEFSNVAMRNVYIQRVQLLALTTNVNHWRNVTIYVTKKRINFQGNYLVLYRFLSKKYILYT